ncbi:MAG: type III secretion system inner rod subunit SctI [Pseudomonas sp.]|jgi:hypothetical protein|uniref:type III secretion system inner rod subunit SctI n=1 Tax=Pseudomonas sp. TaxID=306 RepID=UPI00239EE9E6|nr:type III secretion system inner rod subunit SctI [Pseudomonas sp.]MDE1196468.1 type III secretion system inner rod subunit SctI [Pseudomonas sp.]
MSIQPLFLSSAAAPRMAELPSQGQSAAVSLEDRLLQSFAGSAVDAEINVARIDAMLGSADITDPEVLAALQQRSGEYAIEVSMINALVRKGVSTVETLLRSS